MNRQPLTRAALPVHSSAFQHGTTLIRFFPSLSTCSCPSLSPLALCVLRKRRSFTADPTRVSSAQRSSTPAGEKKKVRFTCGLQINDSYCACLIIMTKMDTCFKCSTKTKLYNLNSTSMFEKVGGKKLPATGMEAESRQRTKNAVRKSSQ